MAAEADRRRTAAIAQRFPPVSFVDPPFKSIALVFPDPQAIARALPEVRSYTSCSFCADSTIYQQVTLNKRYCSLYILL
jgi:hypothetical protein